MSSHQFVKRLTPPSTSISEIEALTGFALPEDYKNYLTNYDKYDGNVGPEFLQLWDMDELLTLNSEYNTFDLLPNTLIIGSNGGGEFIGLEFLGPVNYRVVLSPFIDMNPEYHVEIGNSFSNMLERLNAGKEWFE